MIYQHVNKRAKILPFATFHTAHLCKQFNQVCITNFYATFQTHYYYQNSSKIKLFLKKNAKFSNAGGSAPRPLKQSPPIANSGYAPATLCTIYNHMGFLSFCFERFFLDGSVANLMMLTVDILVCLVRNCFLFEKFYLHYALCDFGSILLHCSKLFIRQSIDREQIFDVTFQNPPLKKSCVRH